MDKTKFDQLIFNDPAYKGLNQQIYPVYKPKYLPYKVHENYNENMYYHRNKIPSYVDSFNRRDGNFYNMYKK